MGKTVECRIAMGRDQRRKRSDSSDDRMIGCGNGVNVPKPHLRARVEQAFRIMKQQSGFDKTRLRGMGKNDSKVLILSAIDQLLHREESSVVDAGGIGSGCSDTKSSYN